MLTLETKTKKKLKIILQLRLKIYISLKTHENNSLDLILIIAPSPKVLVIMEGVTKKKCILRVHEDNENIKRIYIYFFNAKILRTCAFDQGLIV